MKAHGVTLNIVLFTLIFDVSRTAITFSNTWAVHLVGGEGNARDLATKHNFIYVDQIMPHHYLFKHRRVLKRSAISSHQHHRWLRKEREVKWLEQQIVRRRVKRDYRSQYNDQKWPKMWYLNREDPLNMNVIPAWKKGYTGKNVVVTILDDGIERNHPDLLQNYDSGASYDVNGRDADPTPRYDYTDENRHGTRCAGEVAAQANNGVCGMGVAYDSRIGGVRMLDGDVTDAVEAQSLSLNPQHVDIYSASWGPDDDGRTVDGPAALARKAFYDGITKGRGGKGAIFVWASGNGGREGDSCNCDGYTNSIYTLSISSASENGGIPWYSEACSSTLASTYSSGAGGERQIITSDLRKRCTENHTGTSASAPLAAGICALALEANPNLTWRDMQHIVVMTAKPRNLRTNDWIVNGRGRKVSHSFGYGLMDAAAMADLARNWTTVPTQHTCELTSANANRVIPSGGLITVELYSHGCEGTANEVNFLEHVQARITLTSSRRGDTNIYLTSPQGTRSTLLKKRTRDISKGGFNNWAFMTTHSWGETAKGKWILEISNDGGNCMIDHWTLIMRGTSTDPQTSGKDNHTISECQGFILNNMCYRTCPDSYYPGNSSSNSSGVCQSCSEYCSTCYGPLAKHCTVCVDGYEINNATCVQSTDYRYIDSTVIWFYGLIALFCVGTIALFFLIFALLQAREKRFACWKKTGEVVIDLGKAEYTMNGLEKTAGSKPDERTTQSLLDTSEDESSDREQF